MDERMERNNYLVLFYVAHRKAIGILGASFPFVLCLGAIIIFGTGIQSSISNYYHTGMGDVFVGTIWAIAFALLAYKGYERKDNVAGYLGCIFAVGVTLLPTTPASGDVSFVGILHLFFAALFFCVLIYFSLFLFTKTDPARTPTRRKLHRNQFYKTCGYIMSLCIVLVGIYFLLPSEVKLPIKPYNPVFWLEAVAVVAFGISWLIKGETILTDEA